MNEMKKQAIDALNELRLTTDLPYNTYNLIYDGIMDIEPLKDRDEALKDIWEELGDIPMDPDTECIEEPFFIWGAGTDREDIWHWFDERYSKGVTALLYGE